MHEESMAKLESKAAEAELLQTQLQQASEALSLSEVLSPLPLPSESGTT